MCLAINTEKNFMHTSSQKAIYHTSNNRNSNCKGGKKAKWTAWEKLLILLHKFLKCQQQQRLFLFELYLPLIKFMAVRTLIKFYCIIANLQIVIKHIQCFKSNIYLGHSSVCRFVRKVSLTTKHWKFSIKCQQCTMKIDKKSYLYFEIVSLFP